MACEHCPKDWKHSKISLINKSEGNCTLCNTRTKLWACLENKCEFVGCSASSLDHSSLHFKESNHAVAVNLVSYRCWCNICDAEVYMTDYFTAAEMKSEKTKNNKGTPGFKSAGRELLEEVSSKHSAPLKCASLSSLLVFSHGSSLLEVNDSNQGLTGLRNLGNTCYMNAALQSLSNCPQLTLNFLALGRLYAVEKKAIMAYSYYQLMSDMWSSRFASVSPTKVSSVVKMINPMFRGHQQQDTQELLRCLMDRLHEETKYAFPSNETVASKHEAGDADARNMAQISSTFHESNMEDALSMAMSTSSDDSYKLCNSQIVSESKNEGDEVQPMLTDTDFPKELDELHSSGSPLFRSNSFPSLIKPKDVKAEAAESEWEAVRRRTTSHSVPVMQDNRKRDVNKANCLKKKEVHHSVISDIFDGALWSSVQCKTCNSIWHTRETFQDLSLPIPGKDDIARLHGVISPPLPISVSSIASGPCANAESRNYSIYDVWEWLKSWFFGPQVTLTDCLSAFFSADDLKGDNMYSCGKCKKLRNGIKYCQLFKLPEVLCIHLKRFRYEYLTSYSTKISSTVTFPLANLDLSRYVSSDCVSQVKTYDLSSVIVHQGGAGGGHYTSYCKNPITGKWYEFDDQYVTEVSESVVAAAEAYVLFYSKKNEDSSLFREDVLKMDDSVHQSTLMRFFISMEWTVRFLTHVEPGPINNRYFLCRHGNVDPSMASYVDVRVCCVPERIWHALHKRFGGGPAVTMMQSCETCEAEMRRTQERREEEQKMYLKLQMSQCGEEICNQQTYFISMTWFRKWQAFVHGDRDAPDKIDNNSIATSIDGKVCLKKDSDCGELTAEAWRYLHDRYGGGPVIPRAPTESSPMEVD